ncbi:winged helix-turn-helix domain-containing protein [Streptosporangium sp. NPDC006007]|uniref:winged helix-turn-helix domain-containing protein n=1 Tax=Streptosporangium sp. NPDC006007 TaxID=3154575 RepID=UPI0033BC1E7A
MTAMSGTPAYVQVAEDLRTQIRTGLLAPGAQLPSMAQLQERYTVSSTVIRAALAELRRDGLVIGQQGKGVFVRTGGSAADPKDVDELRRRLDDLTDVVRRLDDRVTSLEDVGTHRSQRS